MAGESGPRSGKNAPKKKGGRKAIMSQAAWDKLSNRVKERDYGGTRFHSKKAKSTQRNNEGAGRSSPGARSGDPELEGR